MNTAHSSCAGRQYDEDEEEEAFEARQAARQAIKSTHQPDLDLSKSSDLAG